MKALLAFVVLLSSVCGLDAKAGIIFGNASPGASISCFIINSYTTKEFVNQIEYQYFCNFGPHDPSHFYYDSTPCMGMCALTPGMGASFWSHPVPFGCHLTNYNCKAYTTTIPN